MSNQEITLSEDGSPYPEWRFPPSMACRKWIPHAVTPSVNATARKHMQHQCPYHTLLELPHFVLGMHDLQWLQPRSSSLASPGMPQSEWEVFPPHLAIFSWASLCICSTQTNPTSHNQPRHSLMSSKLSLANTGFCRRPFVSFLSAISPSRPSRQVDPTAEPSLNWPLTDNHLP